MAFYADSLKTHIGKTFIENEAYGASCVAYVKKVTTAPHTSAWRRGAKLFDPLAPACSSDLTIRPGVAIATFDEAKRYPGSDMHAAIFVRYAANGIVVQDQWVGKGKVSERVIARHVPSQARERTNDPDAYFVIETVERSASGL